MVLITSLDSAQNKVAPSILLVFASTIAFRKPSVSWIKRARGTAAEGNLAILISSPCSTAVPSLIPTLDSGGSINTLYGTTSRSFVVWE
ncbi:hypothetical protein D3C76_649100 [compost metagenome]